MRFRPQENFAGCNVCGGCYCETCLPDPIEKCRDCGGDLYRGRVFDATGVFRLPQALRDLPTADARRVELQAWRDKGHLNRLTFEYYGTVIEELAAEEG